MADELTRKLLEEMDQMDAGGGGEADAQAMLTELQIRHRDKIDGALEETGAPKVLFERWESIAAIFKLLNEKYEK
jgi:hypothetical protein